MGDGNIGKKNLIPQNKRSKEEQRRIAAMGGRASGEARREKKRISEMYAEFFMKDHDLKISETEIKKLGGQELLNHVMLAIFSRGDGASVAMLKEAREALEGSKSQVDLNATVQIIDDVPDTD